jgi:hypothetical protein
MGRALEYAQPAEHKMPLLRVGDTTGFVEIEEMHIPPNAGVVLMEPPSNIKGPSKMAPKRSAGRV